MSDYEECALDKTEQGWMSGVRMKEHKSANRRPELARYLKLIREIPEPNFGRIQELKDRIRKKTFFTKEAIDEAAERLAARFLGRE